MVDDKHQLGKLEVVFLSLFVISLPTSEAGKHIFMLLFVLSWIWFFVKDRCAKFKVGTWDWILFAFAFSSFLSTLLAFDFGSEWLSFLDILSSLLLAWILLHSRLSIQQLYILAVAIILPTFIMALWGAWNWAGTHESQFFKLGSVGHTNQSSTYIAIVSGLSFWVALLFYRRLGKSIITGILLVALVLFLLVIWGESRATLLAFSALIFILGAAYCYFRKVSLLNVGFSFSAIFLLFAIFFAVNPYLITKTLSRIDTVAGIDSYRSGIHQVSIEVFRHYPLFGIGVDNHRKVGYDLLVEWTGKDRSYWKVNYPKHFDPHSIYLGSLAERGLFGFLSLSLLLLGWFLSLFFVAKKKKLNDIELAVWGMGVATFVLLTVNGYFNTSFPYENGRLAFLGLGLILSFFADSAGGMDESSADVAR